jgi:hypothetical protein
MLRTTFMLSAIFIAGISSAENVPITGNVSSKCSIYTDTAGVYGNPTPDSLSTDPVDGGIFPVVRFDVTSADYYKAKVSWPQSFASSPTLTDALNWDGEVTVSQTSNAAQSGYETDKVEYENVTEYDLTQSGAVWFQIDSEVSYGAGKSFPGGQYSANITAECIAK